MIRPIAYACLMLVIQASLLPAQKQQSAASIPALQTIQQSLLNGYHLDHGPLGSTADAVDQAALPSGTIEALRQQHNQLIDSYFKNKEASNVDQGVNNTIDGVHNVIQFGALNHVKGDMNSLNGSRNMVNGSDNDVKGDQNTIINSDKNIVHGSGNVIMDGPSSQGVLIETKIKPSTQKTPSSTSPDYSKGEAGVTVTDTPSQNNLSTQFESYCILGLFLMMLQVLL